MATTEELDAGAVDDKKAEEDDEEDEEEEEEEEEEEGEEEFIPKPIMKELLPPTAKEFLPSGRTTESASTAVMVLGGKINLLTLGVNKV